MENFKDKKNDDILEKLVHINRITKVVKGGRRFGFAALMVVGNQKGSVGIGQGKSKQVPDAIKKATEESVTLFNTLLNAGVCREQARMVLPQSMMTEWYWSGTLMAFGRVCNLRCKPDTQLETQMVANQIDKLAEEKFPYSWEALRDGK